MRLETNDKCFACGRENPIGLKMEFRLQGEENTAELTIAPDYQGWAGIAHGGILTTALDEVMARLLADTGRRAITARLEVRFLQPVKVGARVRLRARVVKARGRIIETAAEAFLEDGRVAAEARATSLRVRVSKESYDSSQSMER